MAPPSLTAKPRKAPNKSKVSLMKLAYVVYYSFVQSVTRINLYLLTFFLKLCTQQNTYTQLSKQFVSYQKHILLTKHSLNFKMLKTFICTLTPPRPRHLAQKKKIC